MLIAVAMSETVFVVTLAGLQGFIAAVILR